MRENGGYFGREFAFDGKQVKPWLSLLCLGSSLVKQRLPMGLGNSPLAKIWLHRLAALVNNLLVLVIRHLCLCLYMS